MQVVPLAGVVDVVKRRSTFGFANDGVEVLIGKRSLYVLSAVSSFSSPEGHWTDHRVCGVCMGRTNGDAVTGSLSSMIGTSASRSFMCCGRVT